MAALLEIKDLNVTYRNKEKSVYAVRDVSLSLEEGDALGIVGESGSGKSTLAMGILRLLPETTADVTGTCLFKGETDLLSISQKEYADLRWKDISIVFQKAMNSLSPVHRIRTQIEDIYHVHEPKASKEEIRERSLELFRMVGLPERVYNLYPHEMSGGMLQRVAIAISLLHEPSLLIFDEATTALDVVTQGQILDEVVRLEKSMHMTRIMITHDMSVVSASCSKVAVMYAGCLLEFGPVGKVLKDPAHPYTQKLMESFPSLHGEIRELKSIPGSLPDLSILHEGCVFAERCSKACERCLKERPAMRDVEEGHSAACFALKEVL
ncbi:MAG: ABC transporter ATP-binding protein [Firmicutes bacterium]|nr:ABC transporter ATP-binding protein [Bacillota bacterium]